MVIVGAGECGARAALFLRMEGYTGRVTLIGAEPHLPYERPPVSKAMLAGGAAPLLIADDVRLASAGVNLLRSAEVTRIDRDRREVGWGPGEPVRYDTLLLATGASPRRIGGQGTQGVLYLRDQSDCQKLRERLGPGIRLLVIGAGFLGLEVAASARALGASVTVIESQSRVLMRGVPADIADVIAQRHAIAGVAIESGTPIETIAATSGDRHVAPPMAAALRPTSLSVRSARSRTSPSRERRVLLVEGWHRRRRTLGPATGYLRRWRPLFLPARPARWPNGAARILAQCRGAGSCCGEEHAGRGGNSRCRSLVLV